MRWFVFVFFSFVFVSLLVFGALEDVGYVLYLVPIHDLLIGSKLLGYAFFSFSGGGWEFGFFI